MQILTTEMISNGVIDSLQYYLGPILQFRRYYDLSIASMFPTYGFDTDSTTVEFFGLFERCGTFKLQIVEFDSYFVPITDINVNNQQ